MADAVASLRMLPGDTASFFNNGLNFSNNIIADYALQLLRQTIPLELKAFNENKKLGKGVAEANPMPVEGVQVEDEHFVFDGKNMPFLGPVENLEPRTTPLSILIVGAGVSGLFIALMLDEINKDHKVKLKLTKRAEFKKTGMSETEINEAMKKEPEFMNWVDYKIYEASNRTGGRIYTHHFSPRSHDYFDVGAMRFPQIKIMKKLFTLFKECGINKRMGPRDKHGKREVVDRKGLLIPYYMNGPNNPWYYNDIKQMQTKAETPGAERDIFRIDKSNGGTVDDEMVAIGYMSILKQAYAPFKEKLAFKFMDGFNYLMGFDHLTTRQYLSQEFELQTADGKKKKLDFYTIQWLETCSAGTGWFDQSWTDTVIESFTFESPNPDPDTGNERAVDWYCIEGGTGVLIEKLNDIVLVEPEYNRMVKGMAVERNLGTEIQTSIKVSVRGEHEAETFDTVFNTTTLAAASRMDFTKAELHPGQKTAIRSLRYDPSTKIGIKFSRPWWIEDLGITDGGVAPSDLFSIRMCVYPSYNLKDHKKKNDTDKEAGRNKPAVLLASYCWGQDAQRVGSLIKQTSPDNEEDLRDLLFRDLARLHQKAQDATTGKTYDEILSIIRSTYITHYSYDWEHDPYSSGAFAFFGPGQYRHLYPYMVRPAAASRIHFVGEATSCHHAWIVGALQSAQRAVYSFMSRFGREEEYIKVIQEKWGRAEGVDIQTIRWNNALGYLTPVQQIKPDLDLIKKFSGMSVIEKGTSSSLPTVAKGKV